MRPSRFNILTRYEPTGELLVFNTGSGALVAVPPSQAGLVEELCEGRRADHQVDQTVVKTLAAEGFLVDEDHDEVAQVIDRNRLGISDPNRLDVFILPNMNCNFACPYCYEEHFPSQLDAEVEQSILCWLEEMIPRFKVVLLSWFGGEPLLSFSRLIRIQRAARGIARRAGVLFNSHITTNGYLLTPERCDALSKADLLSYQITMDGPPDIHNQRRVLKGPGNSYERIFANICHLAEHEPRASIKLRVNFDGSTLPRVPELLEQFPSRIRGRLHLVLERIFGQGTLFIDKKPTEIARATEDAYEIARQLGFAVTAAPLGPERLTYCYADRASQFLFNHRGDVFKCTVSDFSAEERLGVLRADGRIVWEDQRYEEWMAIPAFDEECYSCTYLPMCMGGCRKNRAYFGHASDDCTLPFVALDQRVRQRYAAQLASNAKETANVG